ncbi:hypothetical protein F0562_021313 [Nyssa sinensis]|uniref:Uncharacterized protein n=1 Tax=Nyssa sinensis TaxID=561372 RepID=A0A5J5BN74_9ASTE|nr:hypothetical protein F0562_021313 [Nyssa sinensis]
MAESSSISIPLTPKTAEQPPLQQPFFQAETPAPPSAPSTTFVPDKTLSSAANLVKLLPSGTVLTFQSLSPSFSNHGNCSAADKYIIGFLIFISTLTCFVFSFSDSFVGSDGKHYYGIATFKGLHLINKTDDDDGGTNNTCLFPGGYIDTVKELFANLPIGMWLLSGLVFAIFPTTRKGIGYSEMAHDH